MKYRSRTDVVAQILEAANEDRTTKTKIMYRAFLSYTQLKTYLSSLIEKRLLEFRTDDQTYKTTAKGIQFLNIYHNLDQYFKKPQKASILAHT